MTALRKTALLACTVLCLIAGAALPVHATATPAKPASKTYAEIPLNTSDAGAEAIVRKLLAKDLAEYKSMNGRDARIYAQYIALGPDKPKTSIAAFISHGTICGISGCRIVIVMPTQNNKYRLVLDEIMARLFINTRPGQPYYDFLAFVSPRAVPGYGVYFWNDKKGLYEFAGVSKFAK